MPAIDPTIMDLVNRLAKLEAQVQTHESALVQLVAQQQDGGEGGDDLGELPAGENGEPSEAQMLMELDKTLDFVERNGDRVKRWAERMRPKTDGSPAPSSSPSTSTAAPAPAADRSKEVGSA